MSQHSLLHGQNRCDAECKAKRVGAARNGTAGSPLCVPKAAPPTPLTVDDVQEYGKCASETTVSAACERTVPRFEAATGCGGACQLDQQLWLNRSAEFCAFESERTCAATKSPCRLDAAAPAAADVASAPRSGSGDSTIATAPVGSMSGRGHDAAPAPDTILVFTGAAPLPASADAGRASERGSGAEASAPVATPNSTIARSDCGWLAAALLMFAATVQMA
jgi:hypothetical protein